MADEHEQPAPILRPDAIAIQDLVQADFTARRLVGLERYGTLLKAHNGRDMLLDLYQELLDACIYVRGALLERDGK